jgi:hypothetical protein
MNPKKERRPTKNYLKWKTTSKKNKNEDDIKKKSVLDFSLGQTFPGIGSTL